MKNFIEKLASEGHLSPYQIERIGRNVAAMMKAANEDPRLRASLTKLAQSPGWFSHIGFKPLVGTALTLAGAEAVTGIGREVFGAIKSSIMDARNYKSMMQENPQLAKMDAKLVQRHFRTLSKFNPEYASDPNVAGQFVTDSIQMERTPIEQINAITRARKEIADAQARDQTPFSTPIAQSLMGVPGVVNP